MHTGSDVRAYYDSITRSFLRAGGATARTGSLHRCLRVPGARTRTDQINAVHIVIRDLINRYTDRSAGTGESPLVADLGCGVGATMAWMRDRAGFEPVGITLSDVQARIAESRFGRRAVVTGSFTDVDDLRAMTGGRPVSAAYMIESFVHTSDAQALFSAVGAVGRPGSLLVICDDFPTARLARMTGEITPETAGGNGAPAESASGRIAPADRGGARLRLNRRLAADFQAGWHIHSFRTAGVIAGLARAAGWELVESVDLSRWVVTNRPRDLAARASAGPARRLGLRASWWENVVGGGALQRLIRRRLVEYRVLVFRFTPD